MSTPKSKVQITERTLSNIQINDDNFDDVTFTIDEIKCFKIKFNQDKWREVSEWKILLKEILLEIDRLEKVRLIK